MDYPEKKTGTDHAITVVKAGANVVPFVGGAIASVISDVVTPPLTKRREEWLKQLDIRLGSLESDREILVSRLQNDDKFVDVILEATAAADRTSNSVKREALASAVVNAAAGKSPGEAVAQTFIVLIRDWTEWHIKLMRFFVDPKKAFVSKGTKVPDFMAGSRMQLLLLAFPELNNQGDLIKVYWGDIFRQGFTGVDNLMATVTGAGMYQSIISPFGRRFLEFIESKP